ncbi:hypothetical protein DVA67_010175 [Solirubrobacter sp. CPCC 204708]|uniref:Cobalamin-independent methionine synthase MetE C-terminal/archaeal domain-containing protein n=1 Tax=Solirubrobacter deserti TaxID=2282478 RepID=A0ABT4RU84_9ACTN|nr:hypothetical protein [Solirubrobacter deserti]MBE2316343.1 hypothetical protein [Solirubrobacter deserti]MDA0142125.1 hypothetical protein [Solirubrobacter deserti]
MRQMERLPPWATTGVGSLPFTDVEAAVEHVLAAYEIPFCPQLPRLEGDMVSEWLGADAGRCGWSPARDRERPRAWDTLLARLQERPPAHGVVKLQVTGPVTLAHVLGERLPLARELAGWLAANAGAQVRALADRGLDALLMVDEPALHLFGTDGVDAAWDPLRACAPAWGLHLCGPVPWDAVVRAKPDVLSFDLALAPVDGTAARTLLARGTRLMWGAVQPHRAEHALHGMARLDAALAVTGATGNGSLLSPSCGSGRMTVRRERELATALWDCSHTLRDRSRRLSSRSAA